MASPSTAIRRIHCWTLNNTRYLSRSVPLYLNVQYRSYMNVHTRPSHSRMIGKENQQKLQEEQQQSGGSGVISRIIKAGIASGFVYYIITLCFGLPSCEDADVSLKEDKAEEK